MNDTADEEERADKVAPSVDCLIMASEERLKGKPSRVVVDSVAMQYVFVELLIRFSLVNIANTRCLVLHSSRRAFS